MKIAYSLVVLGLLLAAGCFPDSFLNHDANATPASQVSRRPGPPRNYVTPDQVDERNCRDKEKLLRQELELDGQEVPKTPAKG